MSVVVRMEMPQDCWFCPNGHPDWIYNDDGAEQMACFCNICNTEEDDKWISEIETERPSWCPIICQLPEGHGRLVDADEIMQAIDEDIELDSRGLDDMYITGRVRERLRMDRGYKKGFKEYMRGMPTIVPAEEERSET